MGPVARPTTSTLPVFLAEIKFSHSVFALPFALIAMLLAAGGLPSFWTVFWIVIACVAARTAAMCFNRLADMKYDSRNPRTAGRALVTGAIAPRTMMIRMAIAAIVFFFAAGMLNRTCLLLSPPTLGILCLYSLTKRVTNYSHFVLGLALSLAPIGAWIAVRGSLDSIVPVLLSAAVLLWVAGFDILYSCQDYEIDRGDDELHSLPKRVGIAGAMQRARWAHTASLLLFVTFWFASGLGIISLIGILGIGAVLVWQHSLVTPTDLSRINAAFFTANGFISMGFLLAVALDTLVAR